jgi:DNA-directed RNA polymerase specialized sigma24 family protein
VTYAEADLEILWQRAFLRCRAAGASAEDARDCAQDAIAELFAHPDVERPKAWVATVAFHRYIDLRRQRGREPCVGLVPAPAAGATDLPGPEEQAVGRAHAQWLVGAMSRWPASTRAVCSAVGAGMSRPEIVDRLGITNRAVESHLTRARRLLRTLSLLAAAFVVIPGRAIRLAVPAGKPLITTALLVPSAAAMLILGGGGHALDPPSPQAAELWRHPAQPPPVTSAPVPGTTSGQVPNGSPRSATSGPPAPSAGTGAAGTEATATPDLPAPRIAPPLAQVPLGAPPALPIEPPSIQVQGVPDINLSYDRSPPPVCGRGDVTHQSTIWHLVDG